MYIKRRHEGYCHYFISILNLILLYNVCDIIFISMCYFDVLFSGLNISEYFFIDITQFFPKLTNDFSKVNINFMRRLNQMKYLHI